MDIPAPSYTYAAQAIRVIDGDTIVIEADLGFRLTYTAPVRLLGVNSPEKDTKAGQDASRWTSEWLAQAARTPKPTGKPPLVIVSARPGFSGDKYGRWLARIFSARDGACINEDILLAGHAVTFMV